MEFLLDYKLFKYLYSVCTCIYYLTAPKPFNIQLFLSYYITDPHKDHTSPPFHYVLHLSLHSTDIHLPTIFPCRPTPQYAQGLWHYTNDPILKHLEMGPHTFQVEVHTFTTCPPDLHFRKTKKLLCIKEYKELLEPTLDCISPFFTKMSEDKSWAKNPQYDSL